MSTLDTDRLAAVQLLGLSASFQPSSILSPSDPAAPSTRSTATRSSSTKPVAIPTSSTPGYVARNSRRGSEAGELSGSLAASAGSALGSSLLLSGMEKKKAGGFGSGSLPYGMRRENSRSSRKGSLPPALFDFRQTDSSSSPASSPRTLPSTVPPSTSQASLVPPITNPSPSPSSFAPASLPTSSEVILQPGDAEDGEILDPEIIGKHGKRRKSENVFRCESCNKIYRHPSCLVKHRWQHSPHWNESSKLLLSKHQQVQVLEAATILVHLHPDSGTSLPEDKSLWPAAVSPTSHPMPSISFLDSRQVSRANSAAARGTPFADISTTASGSSEERHSGSSPASSTEDTDPDHDHDSGYGGSIIKSHLNLVDAHRSPTSAGPSPIPMGRRTSFGTATAAMNNLALGTSPGSLQHPRAFSPLHSYVSSSPSVMGGFTLGGHGSYSTSTTAPYGSPYGTSPALPLPSSSLRRGSSFSANEDEDEADEDEDEEDLRRRYMRSLRAVAVLEEEDEEMVERAAEEEEEARKEDSTGGAWDMEDMDL